METLRSTSTIANENLMVARPKGLRNNVRKPLAVADNRPTRNVSLKASFKGATKVLPLKENKVVKAVKPKIQLAVNKPAVKPAAKPESLQDIKELKECIADIESYSSVQIPDSVENIDRDDSLNPQLVSCFVNDIYVYIRKLERKYQVKPNHLEIQTEITSKMRAVLIDWLIQVQLRFKLLQETLYMTISILDRYLQFDKVKRNQLQLAGVTAMFIASKYEEMYAPDVGDFVYITDTTYTKRDILVMEKRMLKNLDFNLGRPLPLHFLRRNSKAANVDSSIHAVAKYLMELTLTEYEFASCMPSLLGAASLYLSLRVLTEESAPWTETLEFYSSYKEEELMPAVKNLCKLLIASEKSKLQAVRAKYSSSKMGKISAMPELHSSIVYELAGVKF